MFVLFFTFLFLITSGICMERMYVIRAINKFTNLVDSN